MKKTRQAAWLVPLVILASVLVTAFASASIVRGPETRVWGFDFENTALVGLEGSQALESRRAYGLWYGGSASDSTVAPSSVGALAKYDPQFAARQLLQEGRISLDRAKALVPKDSPNLFVPSETIPAGQKYQFVVNGTKMEVKFHAPDAVAAAKYPGSNAGSMWTAQIKVGNRLLGADGKFYSKPSNTTHIPLVEF